MNKNKRSKDLTFILNNRRHVAFIWLPPEPCMFVPVGVVSLIQLPKFKKQKLFVIYTEINTTIR